ncbi:MAG: M24 family metallopeptidase [Alphaproteobacteria bacterium]|nr:M24 family metallopeptidase [Rickettsiales bacterium]
MWPYPEKSVVLLFFNSDALFSRYNEGLVFKIISGFTGSYGMLAIGLQGSFFSSDSRYTLQSKKEINPSWVITSDSGLVPKNLITKIASHGYEEILIVTDFASASKFSGIAKFCNNMFGNSLRVGGVSFSEFIGSFLLRIDEKDYKTSKPNYRWIDKKVLKGLLKKVYTETVDITEDNLDLSTESKVKLTIDTAKDIGVKGEAIFITNRSFVSWIVNRRKKERLSDLNIDDRLVISLDGSVESVSNVEEIGGLTLKYNSIALDPSYTSKYDVDLISKEIDKVYFTDLSEVYLKQNIKNKNEINNIVKTHIKDAIAIIKFYNWLQAVIFDGIAISELDASEALLSFRKMDESFYCLSFPTISAMGKNGAIVHYSNPSSKKNIIAESNGIYLLDSGAHYLYGTTDLTRVTAIGCPTEKEVLCATIVLKAHIAVATSLFDDNVPAKVIDGLCREVLQNEGGLQFHHSTGHGVGYFSSVHEGPISISPNCNFCFQNGMLLSNEPGYYVKDKYGIRLENLMFVVDADDPNADCNMLPDKLKPKRITALEKKIDNGKQKKALAFQTISLMYFDKKLIKNSLLTEREKCWLNIYHKKVYNTTSKLLPPEIAKWLEQLTNPIK